MVQRTFLTVAANEVGSVGVLRRAVVADCVPLRRARYIRVAKRLIIESVAGVERRVDADESARVRVAAVHATAIALALPDVDVREHRRVNVSGGRCVTD